MITIIDYDAGNIKSVEKALRFFGQEVCISRDPKEIMSSQKVILPGVGSFGDCMDNLKKYDLISVIKDYAATDKPFLGICLGLQLLFRGSDESKGVEGLNLLDGAIHRIPEGGGLKVPQIGWNSLELMNNGRLFKGIANGAFVYFVHSYYLKADDPLIVTATCDYNVTVHASVEKGNIFGCQFHPEKSSDEGLKILKNFIDL
ncbi:MAG: imidazole glycerol phosphate synthase subunit HisH [Lachnospiraceae bacterium]|nr:imidazole glycerol phosphate synthase subunit HisH [Lachnospiraceae bacterium]